MSKSPHKRENIEKGPHSSAPTWNSAKKILNGNRQQWLQETTVCRPSYWGKFVTLNSTRQHLRLAKLGVKANIKTTGASCHTSQLNG